jgi:putative ABC transport system ATP-binding protein
MNNLKFIKRFSGLRFNKSYIIYSIFFGLSTLVIPLGVQFLVNNLALSGIWLNTVSFLVIIGAALFISQVIRHSQVILNEFLQREIFLKSIESWRNFKRQGYEHYFFENINLIKAFSIAYTNLVEICLVLIFGLITIIAFHPIFFLILFILGIFIYQILNSSKQAIKTSINESNKKYEFHESLIEGRGINEELVSAYFESRDQHFGFIRKNSFKVSVLTVIVHILILTIGIYLIQMNQLSVGQLVSAEILISGILSSLVKLPKTLESIYDYETSLYKLNYALEVNLE